MQQIIENPRTGERIVIRCSGGETAGQLLIFDVFLQPGGHVPAQHVHPEQEERFTILSGKVRFRLGAQTRMVASGETVTVRNGTPHWFGNPGPDPAHLCVEVRPALRMQELLATSGHPDRLIDWALIPRDFRRELRIPHVPFWLLNAVLTPIAWVRALSGG